MQFTPIISADLIEQETEKPIKRSHVAKAQRKRLVELWQKSNISQVKFCQAHNLHPKTFSRWLKEYRAPSMASAVTKLSKTINKQNPSTATQAADANFTLELPNTVKLHLRTLNSQLIILIKELCTCKYS